MQQQQSRRWPFFTVKMVKIYPHLFLRAVGGHTRVCGKRRLCSKPCFRNNHSSTVEPQRRRSITNSTCDFLLTNKIQQRWWAQGNIMLQETVTTVMPETLLLTMKKEVATLWTATWEGHAARRGGRSLDRKETETLKDLNTANNHETLELGFLPSWASDEISDLAETLNATV